jgi:GT2 family glycosyltransferase
MIFETPILLLVFNRPAHTSQVLEVLRTLKPQNLFVVADGARSVHPEDAEKCSQVRSLIENVDWECNLQTLFRQENEGCGRGVAQAISWFFEQVPYGIILEDDCLPTQSFFRFCAELLPKYAENEKVMFISGNARFSKKDIAGESDSYFFLRTSGIWGWATWRRAWQYFDFEMQDFEANLPAVRALFLPAEADVWEARFREVWGQGRQDIWDYQWHYSIFKRQGLCLVPRLNLVKNIGFDADATHTTNAKHALAHFAGNDISFPLQHPQEVNINLQMDKKRWKAIQKLQSNQNTWWEFLHRFF